MENTNELTLFLVEDDTDDQDTFMQVVNEMDLSIECIIANSGVEAVKKLREDRQFSPDYIFLDLNMPLMDGKKCIEEIKKIHTKNRIPIIIHSTANLAYEAEELIEAGAAFYFQKPSDIKTLTEILKKILSAHFVRGKTKAS